MPRQPRGASRSRLRAEALAAASGVRVPARCDVAVVGGGASGLAAAVAAAEAGASVVVLERDLACGRTILATGNGRCNFSNSSLDSARYNDPSFVGAVAGERFGADVLRFFRDCGLAWAEEEGGRLYPLSRQAASVREVLLARARGAGAVLAPGREATSVRSAAGGARWELEYDGPAGAGLLAARTVVVAAGGGERILGELGLACDPFEPVLCSLACSPLRRDVSLDELDGRRAHVLARLLRDGAEVARGDGEVLFRPYGLSGIVVFDLSREARAGDVVALDLTCGMSDEDLARCAPAGALDPVVAAALGRDALAAARDLRFLVSGPAEPERAQVTRGGLACGQFDPATLEARDLPGLFACGEALDVDGACGGFNLAWAWKSGLVAGRSAGSRT